MIKSYFRFIEKLIMGDTITRGYGNHNILSHMDLLEKIYED